MQRINGMDVMDKSEQFEMIEGHSRSIEQHRRKLAHLQHRKASPERITYLRNEIDRMTIELSHMIDAFE